MSGSILLFLNMFRFVFCRILINEEFFGYLYQTKIYNNYLSPILTVHSHQNQIHKNGNFTARGKKAISLILFINYSTIIRCIIVYIYVKI